MALAPRRQIRETTNRYALNEVAERGVVCAIIPGTTAAGEVSASATPTGVGIEAIGVLLEDVESLNFDRHPEYRQRDVVDVGSVVSLCIQGEVVTDQITGTAPVAGQDAFLAANGQVSITQATDGTNVAPRVGYFMSAPDALGYAALRVDL